MASSWPRRLLAFRRCLQLSKCFTFHSCSAQSNSFHANRSTVACDLTSSEALRALRPFYLAVHPDLFAQFPRERNTNEDSLKKLNSYLDALESECGRTRGSSIHHSSRPKPVQLTFFIKTRKSGSLKTVSVLLNAYSIGSAVHDILQSCDLFADLSNPTLSKLIREKHEESQKYRVLSTYKHYSQSQQQAPVQDYPDFDYAFTEREINSQRVRHKSPEYLDVWLKQNLPLASSRLESSKSLRKENELIKDSICSEYGLCCIKIEQDWTAVTVKGHLKCLERALERVDVSSLVGKCEAAGGGVRVVLGHSCRVSPDGQVHLSCEDTLQQWIQYLATRVSKELAILQEIESLEDELLRTIMVTRGSQTGNKPSKVDHGLTFRRPTTSTVAEYRAILAEYIHRHVKATPNGRHSLLDKATTTIHDQRGRKLDCSDNEVAISLVMKSPVGSIAPFLAKDGSVELPLDCSPSALVDFLSEHQHKIDKERERHERSRDEALEAVQMCRERLQLSNLIVKANISNDQTVRCCKQLLQLLTELREDTAGGEAGRCSTGVGQFDLKGHYLSLGNSYSVSTDGELRIPWDFKFT